MKMDIIICGVGGQGNLLASIAIANYSMRRGLNVAGTETIGAAQRGGSVVTHLRISDGHIYSSVIPTGVADIILGFEPIEALRYIDRLNQNGCYIINGETIPTVLCNMGLDQYPSMEEIIGALDRYSSVGYIINASEKARALGNVIMANIVLLGAMTRVTNFFDKDSFITVLKGILPTKALKINLKAFETGYNILE